MTRPHTILVGVFGAAHGIRGEIRLKSYTAVPVAIASYGPLSSKDGRRSFTIVSHRPLKDDMLVVRIDGITDRSAAEALTNLPVFVERDRLPAAEEEEFYHADLIGLQAVTEAGQDLGSVSAVHNFGAGDVLEIAPAEGETILVAFTKAFVPRVDLTEKRVTVAEAALAPPDHDEPSDQQG